MEPSVEEVDQVLKESLDFVESESRRLEEALVLLVDTFSKEELAALRARLGNR